MRALPFTALSLLLLAACGPQEAENIQTKAENATDEAVNLLDNQTDLLANQAEAAVDANNMAVANQQ